MDMTTNKRATQPPGPRTEPNSLEHTNTVLRTHSSEACIPGAPCAIHHRSEHDMRQFPQLWCGAHGILERVCPHGATHPDPDDAVVHAQESYKIHLCDGCCHPEYLRKWTPWSKAAKGWIHYSARWAIIRYVWNEGFRFQLLHQDGPYDPSAWQEMADYESFACAAAATVPAPSLV